MCERDDELQSGDSPARGHGSPADRSRRAFVRKAALIGVPVVLATIPSRTVWAGARPKAGKGGYTTPQADASAGGSVNPSARTSGAQSLL